MIGIVAGSPSEYPVVNHGLIFIKSQEIKEGCARQNKFFDEQTNAK
jgi:hypothetical protein